MLVTYMLDTLMIVVCSYDGMYVIIIIPRYATVRTYVLHNICEIVIKTSQNTFLSFITTLFVYIIVYQRYLIIDGFASILY